MQYSQDIDGIREHKVERVYTQSNTPWFLVGVFMAVALMPIAAKVIDTSMDRMAVVDCTKLQSQSTHYPNFYITRGEKEECDSVHMIINAPVK